MKKWRIAMVEISELPNRQENFQYHCCCFQSQTTIRWFALASNEDYKPQCYWKVVDNKRTTFIRVQEQFTAE